MQLACATAIAILVGACGGEPVGAKVPQPNPSHVAGVAAAAAAALTLADPDLAGHKPEDDRQSRKPAGAVSHETVPGDVLDRAEDAENAELPPCPKAADSGTSTATPAEGIDLSVPNHWTVPAEPAKPTCKDENEDDEGSNSPAP